MSLVKIYLYKSHITKKVFLLFCKSVQNHAEYLINEKTSVPPNNIKQLLKRGNIVWADFGFNVGHEFGGKHPALILKYLNDGEDVYVMPLDSGFLTSDKKDKNGNPKGWFIDIPIKDKKKFVVYEMDTMNRWCNVYRLRCISWLRFDFSSQIGWMRKDYVEKIENATQIYKYFPVSNSKNALTKV